MQALAGGLAGLPLWAACIQAGQLLPYATCGGMWGLAMCGVASLLTLVAAWLSWRSRGDAALRLVAQVGAMLGLAFALALALQALGPWMLSPC